MNVANHTTAKRDKRGFSVARMFKQGVEYLIQRRPVFKSFSIRKANWQHFDTMPP